MLPLDVFVNGWLIVFNELRLDVLVASPENDRPDVLLDDLDAGVVLVDVLVDVPDLVLTDVIVVRKDRCDEPVKSEVRVDVLVFKALCVG
jgi:hypothetical protein